jgi:hypothetical protein
VHPIERLRWIARTHDEATTSLAAEAAWTIAELAAEEPAAVVTACRRLVEAHVTAGPMWWVAATLLAAPEPDRAARDAVDDLLADPSGDLLADELNERLEGAAVLVVGCPAEIVLEAVCQLPSASVRVVASEASRWAAVRGFAAVVAEASGWDFEEAPEALEGAAVVLLEALAAGPVGLVAAPGSRSLVEAAREASVPVWAVVGAGRVLHPQLLDEMLQRAGDSVDLVLPGVIEAVIGPSGLGTPAEGLGRQCCPPAPELLIRAG